jgi:MATE family multidrug resistance protein
LDGIFIGITATRQMLYSMLAASLSFFVIYFIFHNAIGNHALWLAFIIYLSLRGITQGLLSRNILQKSNRRIVES